MMNPLLSKFLCIRFDLREDEAIYELRMDRSEAVLAVKDLLYLLAHHPYSEPVEPDAFLARNQQINDVIDSALTDLRIK
jgi:hypothetical protein